MAAGQAGQDADALRDLVRQTQRTGVTRRALLLHADRLPAALARPHHQRLARDALLDLAMADRAQSFALSSGRVAVVWRQQSGRELDSAMAALRHLVADLPPDQTVPPGQLVSLYDLPAQAEWLLDALEAPTEGVAARPAARPLDSALLARLEQALAQADITPFMRWRQVSALAPDAAARAGGWEERYICCRALEAALCPEYCLTANPWLFRRLTRSFDRRMLSLLTGPRELRQAAPFGLHLCIASILSPEFLRFDTELPGRLRGEIRLYVHATDMLADPPAYALARNFARARGHRMVLADATPALLAMLDVAAAEFDYVQIALTADAEAAGAGLRLVIPPPCGIVVAQGARPGARAWALSHGFDYWRAD